MGHCPQENVVHCRLLTLQKSSLFVGIDFVENEMIFTLKYYLQQLQIIYNNITNINV